MPRVWNLLEHARYAGLTDPERRIAEVITEFDRDLYLVHLDPKDPWYAPPRTLALIHRPPDKESYVVRSLMPTQVDERLIADLIESRVPPGTLMESWEALEKAQEIMRLKTSQEARAERAEMLADMLGTLGNKNYAKHNGMFLDPNLRG